MGLSNHISRFIFISCSLQLITAVTGLGLLPQDTCLLQEYFERFSLKLYERDW
jgi:hypothetical protein